MTEDEHGARVETAREFYERTRSELVTDDSALHHVGVLLEELDRADRIIDGLYEALGPANDDVLDLVLAEVDG